MRFLQKWMKYHISDKKILIKNTAEFLRAKYKGENCGTFGVFRVFSSCHKIVTTKPSKTYYNYWLTYIIIERITGFSREDLELGLLKDNIESRPLWKPIHLQPFFEKYDYYRGDVSSFLFKKGLCLTSGSSIDHNDLDIISNTIKNFL